MQINETHTCGCVIITSEWLLTAAHCIPDNLEELDVLVGTVKLSSGGARYKVKEAIKYHEFKIPARGDLNVTHDIAVIRVDGPIQFNDNVQPIEYSIAKVEDNGNLQVSGWGLLKVNT